MRQPHLSKRSWSRMDRLKSGLIRIPLFWPAIHDALVRMSVARLVRCCA
jgi:hypothetical protein